MESNIDQKGFGQKHFQKKVPLSEVQCGLPAGTDYLHFTPEMRDTCLKDLSNYCEPTMLGVLTHPNLQRFDFMYGTLYMALVTIPGLFLDKWQLRRFAFDCMQWYMEDQGKAFEAYLPLLPLIHAYVYQQSYSELPLREACAKVRAYGKKYHFPWVALRMDGIELFYSEDIVRLVIHHYKKLRDYVPAATVYHSTEHERAYKLMMSKVENWVQDKLLELADE